VKNADQNEQGGKNLKAKQVLTGQSDVDMVVAMPRQPAAMICKKDT